MDLNFLDMDMECKNKAEKNMDKQRYRKLQGYV